MDILNDKDRKYLTSAQRGVKYFVFGSGYIILAIVFCIITGILYRHFTTRSTIIKEKREQYISYIESLKPTTSLEKQLIEDLQKREEILRSNIRTTFNLMVINVVIGSMIGFLITMGILFYVLGIVHRRYLKIIEKIKNKYD